MPVADLQEARDVDAILERAVSAPNPAGTRAAVQNLFVELLDFTRSTNTVALHADGVPDEAYRLAHRDGVSVVALSFDGSGSPRAGELSAAWKALRDTLTGDVLLAAINADGSRVDLLYPALRDGRETLRRMVVRRGEPRRTIAQQLAGIYRDDTRLRRYLSRALRMAREAARGDNEELRRIGILQQVFLDHLPHNVLQALEEVRRMQIDGASLIRRLEALRTRYRLNPPDADEATDEPADAEVVRIVCSDGLVSG